MIIFVITKISSFLNVYSLLIGIYKFQIFSYISMCK